MANQTLRERRQDAEATVANRRIARHALALEILRQGSSLMTMADAISEADRRLRAKVAR